MDCKRSPVTSSYLKTTRQFKEMRFPLCNQDILAKVPTYVYKYAQYVCSSSWYKNKCISKYTCVYEYIYAIYSMKSCTCVSMGPGVCIIYTHLR